MTTLIRSNKISTRNLGNIDGLQGPRDFEFFADFTLQRYKQVVGDSIRERTFADFFTFSRSTTARYSAYDTEQQLVAAVNEPRFHQPAGAPYRGLLMEQPRRNLFRNSSLPVTQGFIVSVSGTGRASPLIVWMEGSGSVTLSGDTSASATGDPTGVTVTATQDSPAIVFAAGAGSITATVGGFVSFVQIEQAFRVFTPSTRIDTQAATVLRGEDTLSVKTSLLGDAWTLVMNVRDVSPVFTPGSGTSDSRQLISARNVDDNSYLSVGRSKAQGSSPAYITYRARANAATNEQTMNATIGTNTTAMLGYSAGVMRVSVGGSVGEITDLPASFPLLRARIASSGEWGENLTPNGVVTRVVGYNRLLTAAEMLEVGQSWR